LNQHTQHPQSNHPSHRIALEQTGAGNRARVDGGGGIDTLVLEGSDLTLDLTQASTLVAARKNRVLHFCQTLLSIIWLMSIS
jgi:hypothetical protein